MPDPVGPAGASDRRLLRPEGVHQPTTFYSHGIVVGNVVYTAGQAPHDADGRVLDPSDRIAHFRAAFENLAEVLRAGGAAFDDVARMTVLLRERDHIETLWEVAREFLADHRPAVTLAVVPGLADPQYLLELDAIAVKEPARSGARSGASRR